MPSYAPPRHKPPKPRAPRPLAEHWPRRRAHAHHVIEQLRLVPGASLAYLDMAQAQLKPLEHCQSNSKYSRAWPHIQRLVCAALGLAEFKDEGDVPAPAAIDYLNPPIGYQFLINNNTFIIHAFEPGDALKRPNRIHGCWAHAPDKQVTLDSNIYSAPLHLAISTYGWNLDDYLKRQQERYSGLKLKQRYRPARNNRVPGPDYYEIVGFVGLNHLRIQAYPGNQQKIVSIGQWHSWVARTRAYDDPKWKAAPKAKAKAKAKTKSG